MKTLSLYVSRLLWDSNPPDVLSLLGEGFEVQKYRAHDQLVLVTTTSIPTR